MSGRVVECRGSYKRGHAEEDDAFLRRNSKRKHLSSSHCQQLDENQTASSGNRRSNWKQQTQSAKSGRTTETLSGKFHSPRGRFSPDHERRGKENTRHKFYSPRGKISPGQELRGKENARNKFVSPRGRFSPGQVLRRTENTRHGFHSPRGRISPDYERRGKENTYNRVHSPKGKVSPYHERRGKDNTRDKFHSPRGGISPDYERRGKENTRDKFHSPRERVSPDHEHRGRENKYDRFHSPKGKVSPYHERRGKDNTRDKFHSPRERFSPERVRRGTENTRSRFHSPRGSFSPGHEQHTRDQYKTPSSGSPPRGRNSTKGETSPNRAHPTQTSRGQEQPPDDIHLLPSSKFADSPKTQRGRSDLGHISSTTFVPTVSGSSAPGPTRERKEEENSQRTTTKDPRRPPEGRIRGEVALKIPVWAPKETKAAPEKGNLSRRPSELVRQIVGSNSPKPIPRISSEIIDPTVRRPTHPNIRSACKKPLQEHHTEGKLEVDHEEVGSHNVIRPKDRIAHAPLTVLELELSSSSSSSGSDIDTAEVGIQCELGEKPPTEKTLVDTEVQTDPIKWPYDLGVLKLLEELPRGDQDLIQSQEALLRSVVERKISPVGQLYTIAAAKPPPRPRNPKTTKAAEPKK